jgi:hypothetical protein
MADGFYEQEVVKASHKSLVRSICGSTRERVAASGAGNAWRSGISDRTHGRRYATSFKSAMADCLLRCFRSALAIMTGESCLIRG